MRKVRSRRKVYASAKCQFFSQPGVEFLLRGDSIPTDGSGRLLITDISVHNGQNSTSDEDALFCHSTKDVTILRELDIGDWYLEPDFENTTAYGKRIDGDNDRGWNSIRVYSANISGVYYRLVRLKRVSKTAVEGNFTCHFPGDSNNNRSLLILYPSEYNVKYPIIMIMFLSQYSYLSGGIH